MINSYNLLFPNGNTLQTNRIGQYSITFDTFFKSDIANAKLDDSAYIPNASNNIISEHQIINLGWIPIVSKSGKFKIYVHNSSGDFFIAKEFNGVYKTPLISKNPNVEILNLITAREKERIDRLTKNIKRLHILLGHPSRDQLAVLISRGMHLFPCLAFP